MTLPFKQVAAALQEGVGHLMRQAGLQGSGDLLERQVQLQLLLAFFCLLVESANGLFAVDLLSFLHSDSPFCKNKTLTPSLTARNGEPLLSTNYRTSSREQQNQMRRSRPLQAVGRSAWQPHVGQPISR